MAEPVEFLIRFRGVRGTMPVPGVSTLRYGGNTSCVEVQVNKQLIVLDAGSGLKSLGDAMPGKSADILLSHTHIDHIIGLPFFAPAYDESHQIRLWAGHLQPEHTLRDVIGQLMRPPLFPLTPENFKASMGYMDFKAGDELFADQWIGNGIKIKTLPLSHPDRATGYRIEHGGKVLCYITDYEHTPGAVDDALAQFVREADCLIYDCTYTDEEFDRYRGWGHSTWQQGVRLAAAGGAKMLAVFHHDPDANDSVLDQRGAKLNAMHPASVIAKEGLEIRL